VRVTDYQSGELPKNPDAIVIAGGAEPQRAHALAEGATRVSRSQVESGSGVVWR